MSRALSIAPNHKYIPPIIVGDRHHFPKKSNVITQHEKDIQYCVHCVIYIKEFILKKVHTIKDLLQFSMSSACLIFALYLNQISHLKMFLASHLITKRTRNQTTFRYNIVPYVHILVPLRVPLRIFRLLIFRSLLLLINTSVNFSLFISFFCFFCAFLICSSSPQAYY